MSNNQNNNKLIAKNTILLAIRQFVVMVIALYVSRVTLRVLGVEDFGIYNVVCGFVSMFTFLNSAFTTGIQRFYNYEYGKNGMKGANIVFLNALIVQVVMSAIILVLLESVGLWYMYEKMVIPQDRFVSAMWVFQISVLSTVVMMLQVPYNAAILAHEKMDFFAFLSVLNQLLKLVIVIMLQYMSGDKLILYGFLFLGVTLIDLFLNVLYAHAKFSEINYRAKADSSLLKQMLSFSGWNVFGKFSFVMREQGLNMVLNLFFGPALNAARGLTFQVTGALNGFVSNIGVAVKPQLTQSYAQGDMKRVFALFYIMSKLGFCALYFLALPVCLEIDFVLDLWLDKENVPEYTNIFIILVSAISFTAVLGAPISFVVHATGVMKKYQIVTSVVELSIVPIAFFVLKMSAEPTMVFVVALLVDIVSLTVSLYILKGIVDISLKHYSIKVIFPLIVFSFFSFLIPMAVRFFLLEGMWRFMLVVLVSSISSFICFYEFALNRSEKTLASCYVKQYINRFRNHGK